MYFLSFHNLFTLIKKFSYIDFQCLSNLNKGIHRGRHSITALTRNRCRIFAKLLCKPFACFLLLHKHHLQAINIFHKHTVLIDINSKDIDFFIHNNSSQIFDYLPFAPIVRFHHNPLIKAVVLVTLRYNSLTRFSIYIVAIQSIQLVLLPV